MSKEDILIIGAGPAGMAAGFELQKAGKRCTIIEKQGAVGGLAKTLQYGDFRTDIGPHRFFSQNKYLYDMLRDLLGERWGKVDRLTRFFIGGKFFLYPIDFKEALLKVGIYKASRILFDYSLQRGKRVFVKRPAVSFEEQVISEFGRTLAELNMLNYTEKIWGLPCSQISTDWFQQRIKGLSLKEVIKKIFIKSKEGPKTLVDQFYYPDIGTGLIYERMKERILTIGSRIEFNSHPIKLICAKRRIKQAVLSIGGTHHILEPQYILSSVPLTELVGLLEPGAPQGILENLKKLRFRSVVAFFMTLKKPSVGPEQWIYFPDKEIPFIRMTEPKNFSKKMSPANETSLLLEFFCWENDKTWNFSAGELFEIALKWLEKLGFVKREEVINYWIHKERHAYPVYDLQYRENREAVMNYLRQFVNLQLIGRAGSFRYNNQDHALEMGILAARNIIEGNKYDIEQVGSEQKYFERGYIR